MTDIKVGSEWVNRTGRMFTILAIDEGNLFVKFDDGKHGLMLEEGLRVFCKPLPKRRTVWLNVYDDEVQCYNNKNKADNNIGYGLLWQQEVELIDPREGGEK